MSLNEPAHDMEDAGDNKSSSKASSQNENEAVAFNRAKNRVTFTLNMRLDFHVEILTK